jgi:hypothetical protein
MRTSASVSAGAPTAAAAGFVTDVPPRVGELMVVMLPVSTTTAPVFEQVAVTVTVPSTPITTEAGRRQITLLVSFIVPLVMVVPAVPVSTRSTVEFVAPLRAIPLIFTLLVSAAPCPVAVEKQL